jgi:hypothetical protein
MGRWILVQMREWWQHSWNGIWMACYTRRWATQTEVVCWRRKGPEHAVVDDDPVGPQVLSVVRVVKE